ncbi:MAG: patatin-like phospholipase family protein [Acetobacteraceae bacterium]|nr:patatin-like phospholipase family protein [Acetobacteraceae bacterium]
MSVSGLVLASALLALCACQTSQVVMNAPLPTNAAGLPIYKPGYTLKGMLHAPRGEILLALAFSGGGKRSAALAYGALLGLRSMTIVEAGQRHSLLADVDYIASVSGGSFPATYYGLYRDKAFETFEGAFLKRDVNAFIFGIYLLPWNWEWLINPLVGTNDAMAAVYDRLMYHGATFADLLKQGLPMISVNATDLAGGSVFSFNQSTFDLLCSDLGSFPISRAVAASAGFPIVFTPIALASYSSRCTAHPPPGAPPPPGGQQDAIQLSRASALARNNDRLMDPNRTKWVHLMDGGISDNLALRSLTNALILLDEDDAEVRRLATVTRRVIVISVDGGAARDPTLGQRRVVTGLGQIISAISGTQIDAYSFETLLLTDQQVNDLTGRVKRIRCETAPVLDGQDCGDVKGAMIPVSLASVADGPTRRRLQAIPTSLTIPDADVDALVDQGKKLIQTNPTLLGLIADFDPMTDTVVAADNRQPSRMKRR